MTKSNNITGKTINKDIDRLVDTTAWAFVGMMQITVDENYKGDPISKTERNEMHLNMYEGIKEFISEYMLNVYSIDLEEGER